MGAVRWWKGCGLLAWMLLSWLSLTKLLTSKPAVAHVAMDLAVVALVIRERCEGTRQQLAKENESERQLDQ